jgi:glycerophosphoryl diester phosphodiesterase
MRLPTFSIVPTLVVGALAVMAGSAHAGDLRERLYDPADGVMVVAHRACHAPAPSRGLTASVPENSLQALERCIALGVDLVEIDVRRTRDGGLVIMHDAKVDRTTDGKGRVEDLTLAQVRALTLKAEGGAPETPPTLDEYLAAARGRILINLDVKGPIAADVAQAVRAADAADGVLIKAQAGLGAPPLADQAPYQGLAFMPIVAGKAARRAEQLGAITTLQASGTRAIPAVEMDALRKDGFVAVRDAAHTARIRVWTNTLAGKGLKGLADAGGDRSALTDPGKAWGGLIAQGVSIVQTDHPAALLDYLDGKGLRGRAAITVADARRPSPAMNGASSRSR